MAADNRNFADVLDIQGTEVCLSDKKLAETSSETGVQTTDYVLLQDTDGAYHKILKSNFTEAIRNTLAGLLVNNDKGTSVNQIPAIASGDLGSVTPANLASVLGGVYPSFQTDQPLSDFDTVTIKTGIYYCVADSNTLNKPFPALNGGVVYLLFALNSDYAYLILTETGKLCIRKRWYGSWTDWIAL